jgi:hypothetical protein
MTNSGKKVVICGRSNRDVPTEQVREEGYELWYLGTETRLGGDKYYELHDIPCRHEGAIRKLPDEVYRQGLPINNSVTALMVYAWLEGYTDIIVKGNAMVAKVEYLEQRPAVAYVVGWLNGKGIHVEWTDGPKNINYGRK